MVEENKIYCCDNLNLMKRLADDSVNVILPDPPYLYLKNQKLDRPFDEQSFFSEAKRVLKKDGFIVLFGRGTSFYRWNCILADLGFVFKEEVIWNKKRISIPAHPLHRIHETISIHTINGKINKCIIPYLEKRTHNIDSIVSDVKKIKSALSTNKLDSLINFIETKQIIYTERNKYKNFFANSMNADRVVLVLKSMTCGLIENSIIEQGRDHYNTIHPTQKPVRLLERLLALVSKEGDLILDPFSGSGSTAIAAHNLNRRFIGCEIDEEYYTLSADRLKKEIAQYELELELF